MIKVTDVAKEKVSDEQLSKAYEEIRELTMKIVKELNIVHATALVVRIAGTMVGAAKVCDLRSGDNTAKAFDDMYREAQRPPEHIRAIVELMSHSTKS